MAQQRVVDKTGIEEDKKKEKEKKKSAKEGEKKKEESKEMFVSLVRIMSTDVPGNKKVCFGLTRIKGISFSFANAMCNVLNIGPERIMSSLTEDEIKKITDFVNHPELPTFLFNRRRDLETGNDIHVTGTNLDFKKDFDIKRLKQIRSYKGWRHALGLPVRGQRTRSHFRHGKSVGVVKTKQKPGVEAKEGKKESKK